MPNQPDGGLPDQVLPRLADHFHIHREVTGLHPSGKRLRIDAIAIPRDPALWARSDIALGIEFKRATASGRGDSSKVIRQCIDYTLVNWKGFGAGLPIFYCPGFDQIQSWRDYKDWNPMRRVEDDWIGYTYEPNTPLTSDQVFQAGMGYAISGILGQHNVGELVELPRDGWSFVKHGGGYHVQWCERRGVCEAQRNQLRRRIGSG